MVFINDPQFSSSRIPSKRSDSSRQYFRPAVVQTISTSGSGYRRSQASTELSGPTRLKTFVSFPVPKLQTQSCQILSLKAVGVSPMERLSSLGPTQRSPSTSVFLCLGVGADFKLPSQSADLEDAVAAPSQPPTGQRMRVPSTVINAFSLTGATHQQRTKFALDQPRRRKQMLRK